MMKNKAFTYLLGACVFAVWGFIFYRVFVAVNEEPVTNSNSSYNPPKETPVNYNVPDTFKLVLNYRDPFLDEAAEYTEPVPVSTAAIVVRPPAPVKSPVNWSEVQYKGFIINPQSKKKVSLMLIKGKEQMMEDGQEYMGAKLIKNYRDSVKMSYMGAVKFLKIN